MDIERYVHVHVHFANVSVECLNECAHIFCSCVETDQELVERRAAEASCVREEKPDHEIHQRRQPASAHGRTGAKRHHKTRHISLVSFKMPWFEQKLMA